jgi:HAE1 family hydrophobic/amphiphilic exporter-1
MARAIIGGLAFSSVVSLLIVPMFYVWFDDLNLWRMRVFGKATPAEEPPALGSPAVEPAGGP